MSSDEEMYTDDDVSGQGLSDDQEFSDDNDSDDQGLSDESEIEDDESDKDDKKLVIGSRYAVFEKKKQRLTRSYLTC